MYNIEKDLPLYLADLTVYLQSKYGSMEMPTDYRPENHLRSNYFYYVYDYYPEMYFKDYLTIRGMTVAIPKIKELSVHNQIPYVPEAQHINLSMTHINTIEGLSKKALQLRELHMQMYPEYFL